MIAFGGNNTSGAIEVATAVQAHGGPHGRQDFGSETFVVGAMQGGGSPKGHGTAGVNAQLVDAGYVIPIAFSAKDYGGDAEFGLAPTLRAGGFTESHANAGVMPAIAFQPRFARNDRGAPSEIAYPLTAEAGRTGKGNSAQCVATAWAVRRLTPRECERLQGFPDDYTLVPYRGKDAADGPRYKALGNSMAVNCMRWLGRRIARISALSSRDAENVGK